MIVNVPASFTLDELLAHLRQEEPERAEGYYSAQEWADHFGVSARRMLNVLREAKAAGKLRIKMMRRERVDNSIGRTPAYAFDLSDDAGDCGAGASLPPKELRP